MAVYLAGTVLFYHLTLSVIRQSWAPELGVMISSVYNSYLLNEICYHWRDGTPQETYRLDCALLDAFTSYGISVC